MLLWIESQETGFIVPIVFGLWFLASAMPFIVVMLLHKRDSAGHMKAISPVMLTPLSVIVGLLIAFLAARVWSNLHHATTCVGEEATALRQSVLMEDNLPKDVPVPGRKSVKSVPSEPSTDV